MIGFITVVGLLTITPGADTMLVIRNVLGRGPLAGVLTTLGISLGLLVHASLSALGLSLVLVRSSAAFEAVKWAGALYLVYLGLRSLYAAGRSADPQQIAVGAEAQSRAPATGRKSVWEGFLTNVLNPKVAVFYLAILPQFITPDASVFGKSLLLAGIHGLLGLVWLSALSVLLGRLSPLLTRPRARQGLEVVSGLALVGFGLRLALSRR